MRREEIRVEGLAEPISHYTDAVRAGNLLFVSGVVPVDADGKLVGGDDADLGLARALPAPAEHLVAGREALDVDADLPDHAGEVRPLPGRQFRRVRGEFALADRRLAGVDPGRLDLDQDIFIAQLPRFELADGEDVEPPVLVELDRAWHEANLTLTRSA